MKTITHVGHLKEVAKELGVRHDWHEPDEQGVEAEVTGCQFDNACADGGGIELMVVFTKDGKPVAQVNLATLCAFACGTFSGHT